MALSIERRKDGKFLITMPTHRSGGSFRGVHLGDSFTFEGARYAVTDIDSLYDGNLIYIVGAEKTLAS